MVEIVRTDAKNIDFGKLIAKLDIELAERDGDEHAFFTKYNKIDSLSGVLVCYLDGNPVGCGAIKKFNSNTMEIKRLYVKFSARKKGFASLILINLEHWSLELGFEKCILETGIRQPEAISLYKKNGYKLIPNYGQYKEVKSSVCFSKIV